MSVLFLRLVPYDSDNRYFSMLFYCSLKELGVDETKLEPCKFPVGEIEGLR